MKRRSTLWIIVFTLLVAVPAHGADRVIYNGLDLWRTYGDGTTFADFAKTPIPAGFFCSQSKPFTGRIVFKGVPIATGAPGVLGDTDTIVQRLDNAVFDKNGVAVTRIQIRAMEFASVAPLKTACGEFNVKVTLDGEQPITRMRIFRDHEKGGRFLAPIAVDVKISFTPATGVARENLEIRKSLRFPAQPKARWTYRFETGKRQVAGFLRVDTDGDRVPDTFLPGTSNFAAGAERPRGKTTLESRLCHQDDCQHCTG